MGHLPALFAGRCPFFHGQNNSNYLEKIYAACIYNRFKRYTRKLNTILSVKVQKIGNLTITMFNVFNKKYRRKKFLI